MTTVPKSGPQDMCESYRGVLTASTMGKAYARKLRGELLPYLELRAHGSQYGGLPARNTEMATHHARTIMLKAKCERQACGALFMDVKNSFPSLAHVMVFVEQNLERCIAKVDYLVQELPEQYRAREGDFIFGMVGRWLGSSEAWGARAAGSEIGGLAHGVVCGSRRRFSRRILCERHEAR